jgi:hypothetical protein
VSVPLPRQLLNQIVDFCEIQQGAHAIEGDLDAIIVAAAAATIPKWRTFKLLRWVQRLHQLFIFLLLPVLIGKITA